MHHSRVDGRAYPEEDCPTTKALIDGLASRVSDEVFWRQDGTSFPVEYASTPIREDGRITGAVITFLDISERQRHEREVVAIASLSSAMRTATDRAAMLPVVVEQLVSLTLCDAVAIEIVDPSSGDSVVEAGHGQWAGLVGRRQAEGTGINARIAADRQPYLTKDLEHDPEVVYPAEARKGIKGCAALPLVAQEKLIGFIWTGTRSLIEEPVLRLLSTLADIVANAIHRATSHELAIRARAELVVAYDTTLEGWARALELRDRETEGHARRVVDLALSLARRLGVEESEMEGLRRGALLHDIGKMGVPDSVLLKPDTLDEGEWEIMRRHPRHAYDLLAPIAYLRDVAELPYSHHEKWDGSGYPRGLKGEAIPLSARIFAIVDVWDALRSDRPYRAAWPAARTIQLLKEQSGKHFDPRVVEAFVDMVRDGP
jgi:putative nucleotidyltransferase with HDIG domain